MEKALLRKVRDGSAEAFSALVEPFSGMVYRQCLQMLGNEQDAQDAAQETLLRAYRAIPRFLGQSSVSTWLWRIARNTCLDLLKKPSRKRESASLDGLREAGFDPPGQEDNPETAYWRQEGLGDLREAVKKLPADQQTLLNLRYGEQLSYEELARVTGLPEGTVKSRLNRAKARLKVLLDGE